MSNKMRVRDIAAGDTRLLASKIDIAQAKLVEAASVQSLRSIGDARGEVALIIDDAAQELTALRFAFNETPDEKIADVIATLRDVAQDIKTAESIIVDEAERFGGVDELDDHRSKERLAAAIEVAECLEIIKNEQEAWS